MAKKKRNGYCRACGAKLKTAKSLARGFGPKCFEKNSMIVLDIRSSGRIITRIKVDIPEIQSVIFGLLVVSLDIIFD